MPNGTFDTWARLLDVKTSKCLMLKGSLVINEDKNKSG